MFRAIEEVDINWLQQNHQMLHYFGLGFIQLKINDQYRMHFYTKELPPIVSDEDIHNHRYDFTSRILKGEFSQELYKIVPGNDYLKEEESCQEGIKSESKSEECNIELISRETYTAGSEYFISHKTFHRVKATNCITLLSRSDYKKELAEVVRRKDSPLICPFSQKLSDSKIWDIISSLLN